MSDQNNTSTPIDIQSRSSSPNYSSSTASWINKIQASLTTKIPNLEKQLIKNDKRKLADLIVSPGKISAKLYTGLKDQKRIELRFAILTDEQWDKIIIESAKKILTLILAIGGELSQSLEDAAQTAGFSFIPNADSYIFYVNSEQAVINSPESVELIRKLFEHISNDPFTVLNLHGRGKEELIEELERNREEIFKLTSHLSETPKTKGAQESSTLSKVNSLTTDHNRTSLFTDKEFWNLHPIELPQINVVADELPGKTFRRLGGIHFEGIELDLTDILDRAYFEIAKKAQAYAIDL